MKIETSIEWMNAAQVYLRFGIARAMLKRLAFDGKVRSKRIEDDYGVLNLYLVADIENIVNGSDYANT